MIDCDDRINTPKKTIPIETGEAKSNRCKIFNALVGSDIPDMTDVCAAAICGNIFGESGYNQNSVNSNSGAYGICHWLGSRKTALKNLAAKKGKSVSDLDLQIEYLIDELKHSENSKWKQISGVTAYDRLGELVKKFCNGFERPGPYYCNDRQDKCLSAAKYAYEACKQGKDTKLA